jgi:trans-aconitate 2-methyltransferase
VTTAWDPEQYRRFEAERSRPFFDLVQRTPRSGIANAADLGCGTGALTATLLARWPGATITGVDSSPEMLERAAAIEAPERLRFLQGDLRHWQPGHPLDCILSNAVFQWVPGHASLMPRLVSLLAPRGTLAFQVPNNRIEPAYVVLWELREQEPWVHLVPDDRRFYVEEPSWYVDTFADLGCDVDLWETIYYHQLPGPDAVVEWIKGSALRPVMSRLDEAQRAEFLATFTERVRQLYPAGPGGTLFPFRRLFVVAQRRP